MIRWIAWALTALGIGEAVASRVLDLMNGRRVPSSVVDLIVLVSFSIVGGLIASRRPRNPIGWIYLAAGVLIAIGGTNDLSTQYAYYAVVTRPGSLPGAAWVLGVGHVGLALGFLGLLTFPLLLFPDGRLPSPRWRPLAIAAVVAVLGQMFFRLLTPGPFNDLGSAGVGTQIMNPTGVDDASSSSIYQLVSGLSVALYFGVLIACISSVFLRFRAAAGPERQQLKWFAYGAAWIPAVALVGVLGSLMARPVMDAVGAELWPLSAAGIPIATAIAILRYRLYDIDLLINRTVVYGATTAAIAVTFFAGILALQAVLRPGSELAIAASTLVSFALFQPIRRRVQDAVDRRFDRSRYDAARTLDQFADRLRDEVDLDALRTDLLGAVRQTMGPTHASLWLRK